MPSTPEKNVLPATEVAVGEIEDISQLLVREPSSNDVVSVIPVLLCAWLCCPLATVASASSLNHSTISFKTNRIVTAFG